MRSTDLKAVAASIPLRSLSPASWHDGLAAAYKSSGSKNADIVFIAPPINGWICIVGWWAMGSSEKDSARWTTKTVSELSARFGEAHGYASYRIIEYHHWIMAKQGRVSRCFAYLGESGEVQCNSGAVTNAEKKLRYASLPPDQWAPDEEDVMAVASGWSFDPTKLSASSGPAASGILGHWK